MSGHVRWDSVKPQLTKQGLEIQMAYVDGYILALEDAFKDLAAQPFPGPEREETDQERGLRTFLFRCYRTEVRRQLVESLNSARQTMKRFREMYEGKTDGGSDIGEPATEAGVPEDV